MVAVPAPTPLTSPLPLTVATDALLVAHVTARPSSGVPLASFGVAVSCAVAPTCTLAVAGLTATEATGGGSSAVVPLATLDNGPYTAFPFIVPRTPTRWNW